MSIKIIGGLIKGLTLLTPPSTIIRPTSILLKRKVFDCYQNLGEVIFVDLFSGSGAVALEAWSRGADKIFLVENDNRVLKVLKENVNKIKNHKLCDKDFKSRPMQIFSISALKFLDKFFKSILLELGEADNLAKKVVVYVDPPYEDHSIYEHVIKFFINHSNTSSSSAPIELWIESDLQKGITPDILNRWGIHPHKLFFQGSKFISISLI